MVEVSRDESLIQRYYCEIASKYVYSKELSCMIDKYYCGIDKGHDKGGFNNIIFKKDKAYLEYSYLYDRDETKKMNYMITITIDTKYNRVIKHRLKIVKDGYTKTKIGKIFDNVILNLEYQRICFLYK